MHRLLYFESISGIIYLSFFMATRVEFSYSAICFLHTLTPLTSSVVVTVFSYMNIQYLHYYAYTSIFRH